MKRQLLGVLGLAMFLTGTGCGGDGGGGSTITTSAEVQTACDSYCTALIAKACTLPIYASVAECKMQDCQPLSAAPPRCNAVLKADYDCRAGQTDICADDGCATQDQAVIACAAGG